MSAHRRTELGCAPITGCSEPPCVKFLFNAPHSPY